MKEPVWNCDTERKRKELTDWTLAQLGPPDEPQPTPAEIEAYIASLQTDTETPKGWPRAPKRDAVITAAKAKDLAALKRLTADDPNLGQLALRVLTHKPRRGRPKGARLSPKDIPSERGILREAAADVRRIYKLWQREFGKRNRSPHRNPPTAVQIAAERWHVEVDDLERYRKTFAD